MVCAVAPCCPGHWSIRDVRQSTKTLTLPGLQGTACWSSHIGGTLTGERSRWALQGPETALGTSLGAQIALLPFRAPPPIAPCIDARVLVQGAQLVEPTLLIGRDTLL